MGSLSIWHWLVVLVVVALIFGTKKLSTLGSDLGKGLKSFKEAMREEEETLEKKPLEKQQEKEHV